MEEYRLVYRPQDDRELPYQVQWYDGCNCEWVSDSWCWNYQDACKCLTERRYGIDLSDWDMV